jgi:uncharacterized repeat protein (TIGR03803 family)
MSSSGGTKDKGTIFKFTSDGTETVLYSFTDFSPVNEFAMDSSGNFYGAALGHGRDLGAIFKISATGTETILHKFSDSEETGGLPFGGVTMDAKGNLFGTAAVGGQFGGGTIFEVATSGKFSTLHSFSGDEGNSPHGGVALDAARNLFGTAAEGGTGDAGTLFELTSSGDFTVLHSFAANHEGDAPIGRVVVDDHDNVFGTVAQGGDFDEGTLFKYDASGNFSILHEFWSLPNDGVDPQGGLALETNGDLFGVTTQGGDKLAGVIYKLTPRGKYSILHSFEPPDGNLPPSCIVSDHAKHLFGTTTMGGTHNAGTVYRAQE